ncbi:MAG: YtxH domain-containing protein [Verrucomicrobia bacterium]|nr:YtxH domain-containing protein [Verrucomicrobiota bacterium]MBS0646589.1 YtxH domain-containing protein [Verrucomicrobiota bacterium]
MFFQRRKTSHTKSFLKGALLGGIALGITALLFAPKTGKQARADLKKKYKSASKATKGLYKNVVQSAEDFAHEAKKKTKRWFR